MPWREIGVFSQKALPSLYYERRQLQYTSLHPPPPRYGCVREHACTTSAESSNHELQSLLDSCVCVCVPVCDGEWRLLGGTSSSVISGALPRVEVLQRNALPLLLPSLSLSVLLPVTTLLAALLHLSPPLRFHPRLFSLSTSRIFLGSVYIFCILSLSLSLLHVSPSAIDSSSPPPLLLSLTDRKTNVRSERLFNLKLCCSALNINSVLV